MLEQGQAEPDNGPRRLTLLDPGQQRKRMVEARTYRAVRDQCGGYVLDAPCPDELFCPEIFHCAALFGVVWWMLIDVSRRPIRLIFEECPGVVVVRTIGVAGNANGLLHQDNPRNRKTHYTATPEAKMMHRDQEIMETILFPEPVPEPLDYVGVTFNIAARRLRALGRDAVPFAQEAKPSPVPGEPYYVVTVYEASHRYVYHNQGLATGGVWRLNFIFDPGPKEGTKLLTLLDETHSTMLFTMVIPIPSSDRAMFKVVTPLQRLIKNQIGNGGLWAALEDADD